MSNDSGKAPAQEIAEQATDEANSGSTAPQGSAQESTSGETNTNEQAGGGTEADETAAGPAEEADPGQEDNPATTAPVE